MGPPPDRDAVMGPPPVPPSAPSSPSKQKDSQDLSEKYRKLKRKYYDLEEVSMSRLVYCLVSNGHLSSETQGD
jgi:hypothetical protein